MTVAGSLPGADGPGEGMEFRVPLRWLLATALALCLMPLACFAQGYVSNTVTTGANSPKDSSDSQNSQSLGLISFYYSGAVPKFKLNNRTLNDDHPLPDSFSNYEVTALVDVFPTNPLRTIVFNSSTRKLKFFFDQPVGTTGFSVTPSPTPLTTFPEAEYGFTFKFQERASEGRIIPLKAANVYIRNFGSKAPYEFKRFIGDAAETTTWSPTLLTVPAPTEIVLDELVRVAHEHVLHDTIQSEQPVFDFFASVFKDLNYSVEVRLIDSNSTPAASPANFFFVPSAERTIADLLDEAVTQNPTLEAWYFSDYKAGDRAVPTLNFRLRHTFAGPPPPKTFSLKFADPQQVADIVQDLYGKDGVRVQTYGGGKVANFDRQNRSFKALFEGNLGAAAQDLGVDIEPLNDDVVGSSPLRAVVVRAQTPLQLKEIGKLITRQLDIEPRMVSLDVQIYEVSENGLKDFGLRWGSTDANGEFVVGQEFEFDEQDNPASSNRFEALTIGKFHRGSGLSITALLNALQEAGRAELLVNTTLTTIEDKQATYFVGKEVPYPFVASETGVLVQGAQPKQVGVQINFVPHLYEDGTDMKVKVHLRPVVSSVTGFVAIGNTKVPEIATRQSEAIVNLNDGCTHLLGRLISEEELTLTSKTPLLGDMPLIGKLFRNKYRKKDHIHVCILVTPHFDNSPRQQIAQAVPRVNPNPERPPARSADRALASGLYNPYPEELPLAEIAPVDLSEIADEDIDEAETEANVLPDVPTYRSAK